MKTETELDRRPVCVKCQVNLRVERNGVLVRLWSEAVAFGDLYQCPRCDFQVVAGFGKQIDSHEVNYEAYAARLGESRIVDHDGKIDA